MRIHFFSFVPVSILSLQWDSKFNNISHSLCHPEFFSSADDAFLSDKRKNKLVHLSALKRGAQFEGERSLRDVFS